MTNTTNARLVALLGQVATAVEQSREVNARMRSAIEASDFILGLKL